MTFGVISGLRIHRTLVVSRAYAYTCHMDTSAPELYFDFCQSGFEPSQKVYFGGLGFASRGKVVECTGAVLPDYFVPVSVFCSRREFVRNKAGATQ